MSGQEIVDTIDVCRSRRRQDAIGVAAAAASVAGIDQERLSGGRYDKGGLAALNVDEEDLEPLGGSRSRQHDDQEKYPVDPSHKAVAYRQNKPYVAGTPAMTRFDVAQVRRYYDRQTSGFLAFGEGGRAGAIHRGVWGPGVRDRDGAFRFVEGQIADLIRRLPPVAATPHVIDLGCGVGASLCYLAARLPLRGTGITLSPVQAALAARRIRDAGLTECIQCLEGDYCDLPPIVDPADLAYAIESFVHVPIAVRFFEECRRLIRPGGTLVIVDDFKRPGSGAAASRAIEQFCRGWHINALIQPDELRTLARAAGFEHESTLDLSSYLELGRIRERVIGALIPLVGWLPLERTPFGHLAGGRALHECLAKGWIGYEMAVFRRGG